MACLPSGKSWDECSGKTGSGKKFYHNIIQGSDVKAQPFYVAIITPVIHYCMGGLEIDADGAVLGSSGKVIKGLYCAGEVAGGVHGNNRLGGNSLLDCVVFGRVTGKAATKYILGGDVKQVDLKELTGGGLSGEVKGSKFSGGSYEDNLNEGGAAPAKKEKKEKKEKAKSGGGGGFSMGEVAKHVTKSDCWVVVAGQVLDVTNFLSQHPGGELAILTFAGKDATEEFNMIHPPDVIPKYAPDAIIGVVGQGGGGGKKKKKAKKESGIPRTDTGHKVRSWKKMEDNRKVRMEGHGKIGGYFGALCYMVLAFMKEIVFTIFGQTNISIDKDRVGVTRSAFFLFVFIVIHAVGNLHVFLGPDDFNGYGYFYVRLYPTGFGLPANIVEEYVLLAALLHIFVALKRTWDISINYTVASGKLNLAMSGIALLTFMTIHLFQYRFGETQPYNVRPPPYLINVLSIVQLKGLNLFWTDSADVPPVPVRNIYKLEYDIFASWGWCVFYIAAVIIFSTHTCLGWAKVVTAPALEIGKRHQTKAAHIGYIWTGFVAMIYISFPIYCYLTSLSPGCLGNQF